MSGRGGRSNAPTGPLPDGQAPESTDFANYFCTYAYIYHQKDMLEDAKRTGAYYNAVMQNRAQFAGKVVLDVGTGSGVLAIFAAKAGARRVYAVEATDMAKHAREVVKGNGLEDTVTVIQGMIESVELPEKVDIIISEWMGYFLLRESMLDSVLVARDRFLKPGGALYPSHARLYLAGARSNATHQRRAEFQAKYRRVLPDVAVRRNNVQGSMEGWAAFCEDMQQFYGLDLGSLSQSYREEQREYYVSTAAWSDVHPSQLVGPPACLREYDLLKVTVAELEAPLKASARLNVLDGGPIDGFVGFFDTQFKGSPENPASMEVLLSTAPDATGATHWGQQMFFLDPSIHCAPNDELAVDFEMRRKEKNHRLMHVRMQHRVEGPSPLAQGAALRTSLFNIE